MPRPLWSSLRTAHRLRWLAPLIAILALAPAVAVVALQQITITLPPNFTPARGHAEVIAHGVVQLPTQLVVWRTVRYTAPPRTTAPFATQPVGFVIATDGPILLTDRLPNGTLGDKVRVAIGEATVVRPNTVQQRASLTSSPTTYTAMELVPVANVNNVGSNGTLLYHGLAFMPPPGERDINLVRDVLLGGESVSVPQGAQSNVIMATDGSVDVLPSSGGVKTLRPGDTDTFPGAVTVRAAAGNAAAGLALARPYLAAQPTAQAAASAAFVVAVIGVEVPPPPTAPPLLTPATPPPPPPPPATPVATPSSTLPPTNPATITAYKYFCPPGYGGPFDLRDLQAHCPTPVNGVTFRLLKGNAPYSQSNTGDSIPGAVTFGGLAPDTYTLVESPPPGTTAIYAFCATDDQAAVPVPLSGGGTSFNMNGQSVTCAWYDVPAAAPTTAPSATATVPAPTPGTPPVIP